MKGHVYILTNASLPGMVKIGMTRNNPHNRASQLSTTGVPNKFKVFGYVYVDEPNEVELKVHRKLAKHRVSKRREFFKISPDIALSALEEVSGEHEVLRKEKEVRIYVENLRREELSRKKAYDEKLREEWQEYFSRFEKESSHSFFYRLSDLIGNSGWIVFAFSAVVCLIDKNNNLALYAFVISLAIGIVSLFFYFVADRGYERVRYKANLFMKKKYGNKWEG